MRKTSMLILTLFALSPLLAWADDDPEPPGKGGPELRKLRGKWVATRRLSNGKEMKPPAKTAITYVFDGDKVTYESGKLKYVAKVKVDTKSKPHVLELIREDVKSTRKMAFKIDKGELYLASGGFKGDDLTKVDFSGNNGLVLILEREKKDK